MGIFDVPPQALGIGFHVLQKKKNIQHCLLQTRKRDLFNKVTTYLALIKKICHDIGHNIDKRIFYSAISSFSSTPTSTYDFWPRQWSSLMYSFTLMNLLKQI